MKISNLNTNGVTGKGGANKVDKPQTGGKPSNVQAGKSGRVSDQVEISAQGSDIGALKAVYDQIHTDQIAELKGQIDKGEYNPSPKAVAKAIIEHIFQSVNEGSTPNS